MDFDGHSMDPSGMIGSFEAQNNIPLVANIYIYIYIYIYIMISMICLFRPNVQYMCPLSPIIIIWTIKVNDYGSKILRITANKDDFGYLLGFCYLLTKFSLDHEQPVGKAVCCDCLQNSYSKRHS